MAVSYIDNGDYIKVEGLAFGTRRRQQLHGARVFGR